MGETQLNLLQVIQGDQSELTEKLGVSSKEIFGSGSSMLCRGVLSVLMDFFVDKRGMLSCGE